MLAALLPGSTAPASAQPDDRPCIEAPTAACLTRAAVAAFAEVDDPAVWMLQSRIRPTLSRLLVETGQEDLLPVYWGLMSRATGLVDTLSVLSAATAHMDMANPLEAAQLIRDNPPTASNLLYGLVMMAESAAQRGDVQGVLSVVTLSREFSSTLPRTSLTLDISDIAADIKALRESQDRPCPLSMPVLNDIDAMLAILGRLAHAKLLDAELAVTLTACGFDPSTWTTDQLELPFFNPLLRMDRPLREAPFRSADQRLTQRFRHVIQAGLLDAGLNEINRYTLELLSAQVFSLTAFPAADMGPLIDRWLSSLSDLDPDAEDYLAALTGRLGDDAGLQAAIVAPPPSLTPLDRFRVAALLSVYAAARGNEGLMMTVLDVLLSEAYLDAVFQPEPEGSPPPSSNAFAICGVPSLVSELKFLLARIVAMNADIADDAALDTILQRLCAEDRDFLLYELALIAGDHETESAAVARAFSIEDDNLRAVTLARMARVAIETRYDNGTNHAPTKRD